MLKEEFKRLFDPITPDPSVQESVERRVFEHLNRKKARHPVRRALVLAAMLSLLATGAAMAAAHSGILDRLFPGETPSDQALTARVESPAAAEDNGVSLQIDEYLLDSQSLHVGWTLRSRRDQPVYATTRYAIVCTDPEDARRLEQSRVGGAYDAYSSGEAGDLLVRLTGDLPAYSGYAGCGFDFSPAAPIDLTLTVCAYESALTAVEVPSALDTTGDAAAVLEQNGQLGVDPNQWVNVREYAAFRAALDAPGDLDWDAANEQALTDSGLFEPVAELTLTVRVAPSAAPRFRLAEPLTFALSDRTVTVRALTLDAASTTLEYEVVTAAGLDSENVAANGITCLLLDQDGRLLNVRYALSASVRVEEDANGLHRYAVQVGGHPLPESVTAITFVPTAPLEHMEGEDAESWYLRMSELSGDAQRFTVELS